MFLDNLGASGVMEAAFSEDNSNYLKIAALFWKKHRMFVHLSDLCIAVTNVLQSSSVITLQPSVGNISYWWTLTAGRIRVIPTAQVGAAPIIGLGCKQIGEVFSRRS